MSAGKIRRRSDSTLFAYTKGAEMEQTIFGTTRAGETAHLYTLSNHRGMKAVVSDFGAVLVQLWVPDRDGNAADVVLGYETLSQYEINDPGFGATIGRHANRIGGAAFVLNGKTIHLEKNDGENNLHSGQGSYHRRLWQAEEVCCPEGESVRFSLYSPDGDQGFPGNLQISLQYVLTEENELKLIYRGQSDADTVLNLTNHSYFNLAGQGSVLEQLAWIDADFYTRADAKSIPTGEILPVEKTPMDFRDWKKIGAEIGADYEALNYGQGYDHNYVLNTGGKLALAAKLWDPESRRVMEVYTDRPGMQLYSANFLDGTENGKGGLPLIRRGGICFETQYYPDSVHHENFPSCVLKAGEVFESATIFRFSSKGTYDFDTVHSRKGTGAEKWSPVERQDLEGVVPFSIADMEFPSAPQISEKLRALADTGIWGYTCVTDRFRESVCTWMARRHHYQVQPEWIVNTYGVVPAFYTAVRALTGPGDGVLIQTPAYPPFYGAVRDSGRKLVENPLKLEEGVYRIDFDDLEQKCAEAKLMIFCNPHNPTGRVWSEEELRRVGEICRKHGVVIFSDEIHSDLIMRPNRHHTFASLDAELEQMILTGFSASKTFSLAGLICSSILIPNPSLREKFEGQMEREGVMFNNVFGQTATQTAFEEGEEWLEELLPHIWENYLFVKRWFAAHFPQIHVFPMEGTYLLWADFSGLGLNQEELEQFLQKEAKLYLDEGYIFGPAGSRYERINLACPRTCLEEGLGRLLAAWNQRQVIHG